MSTKVFICPIILASSVDNVVSNKRTCRKYGRLFKSIPKNNCLEYPKVLGKRQRRSSVRKAAGFKRNMQSI